MQSKQGNLWDYALGIELSTQGRIICFVKLEGDRLVKFNKQDRSLVVSDHVSDLLEQSSTSERFKEITCKNWFSFNADVVWDDIIPNCQYHWNQPETLFMKKYWGHARELSGVDDYDILFNNLFLNNSDSSLARIFYFPVKQLSLSFHLIITQFHIEFVFNINQLFEAKFFLIDYRHVLIILTALFKHQKSHVYFHTTYYTVNFNTAYKFKLWFIKQDSWWTNIQ